MGITFRVQHVKGLKIEDDDSLSQGRMFGPSKIAVARVGEYPFSRNVLRQASS